MPRHEITCQFGLKWEPSNAILITLADVKEYHSAFLHTELLFGFGGTLSKCHPGDDPKYYLGFVIMTPHRQDVLVYISLILKVNMYTMFVSAGNELQ